MHFAVLGVHFNVDVADAAFVQLSQFEFIAKKAFGLAHDGPDDVLRWTVPFTLISARISYFMALPLPPPPRFELPPRGLSCFFPCGFSPCLHTTTTGAGKGCASELPRKSGRSECEQTVPTDEAF